MAKFNKLKTYNIMIFALVPLLIIAMVATVTLAAMTTREEGKNTIPIANVGTITGTVTASDKLYPGGTFDINLNFDYSGATGISGVVVDVASFTITSITATTASNTYSNIVATDYFTSDDLLDGTGAANNITVNQGGTAPAIIRVTVKPGTDGTSNIDPSHCLTYSVTSIQINFTVNVTYNNA